MSNVRADSSEASLLEVLHARIGREGPMPIDEYMRLCAARYWTRDRPIGALGDFITAPEISQVFGELIGIWCASAWDAMGRPPSVLLVELGPGRGTLMTDALRAARLLPGFAAAVQVHMVEVSPTLRSQQETLLAANGHTATWHRDVGDVPHGPAIVIANEFLDALPIRQFVFAGTWRERVVELSAERGLRFGAGKPVSHPVQVDAPEGTIVELRPGEDQLLAELQQRPDPLAALFIDYGPSEHASGDTLQAVRNHAFADPLSNPGEADLTAHVQFASLAQKARARGFDVDGPTTQAAFLGRLGLAERAAKLMAANPAQATGIEAGAQRLVSPTGMGSLFKVLAMRSQSLPPLPGFS
jgi:SAM-dependent MidA family methyltransferase